MARKKKKSISEEFELDQAYLELTGRDPQKAVQKKKGGGCFPILLLLCAAVVICVVGVPMLLNADEADSTSAPTTVIREIAPGVTAGGIDFGGMTEEEALSALSDISDSFNIPMVIQIGGSQATITPGESGVELDPLSVLDALFAAAPDENIDINDYLYLDTEALQSSCESIAEEYTGTGTAPSYAVEGADPDLTNPNTPCQTLVITLGTPAQKLDGEALYQQVFDAYHNRVFRVDATVDTVEPAALDLQAVYDAYFRAPVDAAMDMETFEITKEVYGYEFDLAAAQALLDNAQNGETVEIRFRLINPSVTAEDLTEVLYRDVLSSYSTSHTNDANRNNNLRLACEAINGLILMPGEIFSYNGTLGQRTTEKGYLPAGAYLNGQTVASVGGGICQVSSTLYFCTLIADLEIVDRINHSMTVSYLPLGMDATVNWGTTDFKFSNNTNYPLRIEAWVAGGYVNIQILGTNEKDYYVRMEYEIIETYNYRTEYQEMPADNPNGYKDGDVITSPCTGYRVDSYKCIYDAQTDELISREFEARSTYRVRNRVVVRIVE